MTRDADNSLAARLASLRQRMGTASAGVPWGELALLLVGVLLAIAIRYVMLDFKSVDFLGGQRVWYNTIKAQGFSAFAGNFSDYNPPFLYMLYIVIRINPDIPDLIGVKIPGLIGDFVCAYFVFRIVQLKYHRPLFPSLAALAVLFAPTMILNSALWGQSDSLYLAALLACLFWLLQGRSVLAMIGFGVALALKLQSVFLGPLLLALFLRRGLGWKSILAVPVVMLLSLVPAWMAGRPILDLLSIYVSQSSEFEYITMNAASIYTWLPQTKQIFNLFYVPGVIAGISAALFLVALIYFSPVRFSKRLLIELALLSLVAVPFFLPKMHERYFFPADVLSIVFAFYCPEFFYIPIIMNVVSFVSYEPFLFEDLTIPLPVLALGILVILAVLLRDGIARLYRAAAHATSAQ